ncbi:MAG: hypothetical protein ACK53G_12395, partial [Armatimonadota bacterium]
AIESQSSAVLGEKTPTNGNSKSRAQEKDRSFSGPESLNLERKLVFIEPFSLSSSENAHTEYSSATITEALIEMNPAK